MNKKILSKAKEALKHAADIQEEINDKNLKFMRTIPEFMEVYSANTTLIADYATIRFSGGNTGNLTDRIADNEAKLSTIAKSYDMELYRKTCDICRGNGVQPGGKYCQCLIDRYKLIAEQELKDGGDIQEFRFSDNQLASNVSQQYSLNRLYQSFQQYCDTFPNNNKKHILLSGKSGVGKSCLMSAIAHDLVERCVDVVYLNAYTLNYMLLKHHIGKLNDDDAFIDSVLKCEALFIDDLGCEPAYDNVTLTYLYVILEQRQNKHVFISTNFSLDELLEHYGDRVFTRLTLKENTYMSEIKGDNLRNIL